jgi:two-component system sensor histidine kinase KdpD
VADDLPAAIADPGLLERVIANLVANALTHTAPDVPVRIEATSLGERAVVRVVDRGPGLAADERRRMFDPFQRLGDHGVGGVGLGLAVARGFVDAMGGELSADDTPGGGLTLTVTLPLAHDDGRAEHATTPVGERA